MKVADRWLEWVGVAYIVLVLTLSLNVVRSGWSGWAPGIEALSEDRGATGLAIAGWAGAAVLLTAAWRGGLSALQWWIVASVAAWTVTPAISMVMHGSLQDARLWSVAFASVGVAAAGALVTADALRLMMYGLGWFFGWGSVLAGVSCLATGWPNVLGEGTDRYGGWLSVFGLELGDVRYLNGLTAGRIFVGMTCAVLLVYSVRTMLARSTPRWMWVMPIGLVLAAVWSFARVGWYSVTAGLIAALLPWERIKSWFLSSALLAATLVPLALLLALGSEWMPDSTTRWRFDLWDEYLADSAMLGPFGIGPQNPPDWVRGHAHQQFLESQATGGWLAIAGLVAFLVLGAIAVRAAAHTDNRAGIAVLFAAVAIFQIDVITFAPTFANLNNAFVLVVVVVVSTAGLPSLLGSQCPERVIVSP